MKTVRIFGILTCFALLVGVGCATGTGPDYTGGGGGGGDVVDDPGAMTVMGRITGFVTTADDQPIGGVTVDLVGVTSALTDEDGLFVLTGVEPDGVMNIKFTKRGYTSNIRTVELMGWETQTINARLLPVDLIETIGSQGGRIETAELRVDLPANAFVDKQGQPISSDVEIAVTHIDPSSDEILAAPNDFSAYTVTGSEAGLASYAMIDVSMTTPDGEEVELASGSSAGVELLLPEELPASQAVQVGDVIPTWHFDEELVKWVEEATATVIESTTVPGRLAAVFDAPYFSAWNVDDCFIDPNDPAAAAACMGVTVTCIVGNVDDVGDNEIIGADVLAGNVNLFGTVNDTTDDNGEFMLWPIQQNAIVDIMVDVTVGGRRYSVTDGSFVANGGAADGTDPAQCVRIPTIEVPTCVVGGVVDLKRQRVHNPQVPDVVADAIAGKAYFFEPDGTPETCLNINPTIIPVDTCEIVDTTDLDDEVMDFFWGQAPLDAGTEVELVSETGDTLFLDPEERVVGDEYYEGLAQTDEVDVPFDSNVDVYAVGDQYGLPPTDLAGSLPMGSEMELSNDVLSNGFRVKRGDKLSVTTNSNADSWGTMALIMPDDNTDIGCMCRFNDDGQIDIPADVTSQLGTGEAAMMITRVTTDMEQLPNGYWLRTMGRTSTMVMGEIDP